MTTQRQDLALFADNSIIPHNYLKQEHLFGLITYTQGTSPSWLVNLLVENGLFGSCIINHEKIEQKHHDANVVLISFLQDLKFYERDLKRNGVEIDGLNNFHFIDLFTDLFKTASEPDFLEKLFIEIQIQVQRLQKPIIIVEGIEFLLASTNISSIQLVNQINKLHSLSSSLIIVSAVDQEVIDFSGNSDKTTPEFKTFDFLVRLLHRTQVNISLRPLETGRAKDVTGTLTISQGTIPYESLDILEKEYLFHVSKDQSIRLFYR